MQNRSIQRTESSGLVFDHYPKAWLSYDEQLDRLIDRGLAVSDRKKAIIYLQRLGYYRLSGYWHGFRNLSEICCPLPREKRKKGKEKTNKIVLDSFKQGAGFKDVVELYVFDKKLRLLIMDGIERIEVALRVDIAHLLGKEDRFCYLHPENFHPNFSVNLDAKIGLTKHHTWLNKQASLITRSREAFIVHHKAKYGLPLPIWVACEVWDFGTLSILFSGLKEAQQDQISAKYGVTNGRTFATWLRGLNHLRNICAHHSRLWNRNIVDQPKLPPKQEFELFDDFHQKTHRLARPFLLICITQQLVNVINPTSTWGKRMKELLVTDFPELSHLGITLEGMGIVEDWKDLDW